MTLDDKITKARDIIREYITPMSVLYCSFGKDSMVLLHLTRSMGLDLPVIFNRIPIFSSKQAFANRIIENWNLTVHSFPPMKVVLVRSPQLDIINYYSLPNGRTFLMPVGVTPPVEGLPFACGLKDLLQTPRGILIYPWDTGLIGHKSSDVDPLFGGVPLKDYVAIVSPAMKGLFPIRDFTDADIWNYTERFNVPYNEKRYNRADNYREFPAHENNNDYYPACMKCLDPNEPETVACPKFGSVPNVSAFVPIADIQPLSYMGSNEVIDGI